MECGICINKFPNDCVQFFQCAHYVCLFCFNNLKELKCPYCRICIEVENNNQTELSDDDDEFFIIFNHNNNRKKKRRKNRRTITESFDTLNQNRSMQYYLLRE